METNSTAFRISADLPIWVVIIAFILALLFALWSYRRTAPPVGTFLRSVLFLMRWIALCCGIVIVARPVIETERKISEPASIAVLLDQSASMGSEYDGVSKTSQVKAVLEGEAFHNLMRRCNVSLFGFADSLSADFRNIDALLSRKSDQVGTNITGAWMEVKEQELLNPFAALILISDGVHNKGPDPVRMASAVGIPIWVVGAGSPVPPKDLMITGIIHNPVIYQGSKTPVVVKYRCIDAEGEKATVILRDFNGEAIDRRSLVVDGNFFEGSVIFDYTAKSPGRQVFSAEIVQVDDEVILENNMRSFYLNVLTSKMRVLVMAGFPDNGLGDLLRRLKRDEHIEIESRISKGRGFFEGDWPNETVLAKTDVVILYHFPIRNTNSDDLSRFARQIKNFNLPLCFFDGGRIDWKKLDLLTGLLPVKPQSPIRRIVEGTAQPVHRHTITSDLDQSNITSTWNRLPPLNFSPGGYEALPDSKTLVEFHVAGDVNKYPALVVSETGGTRTTAFLGRNLWLWGLASPGDEGIVEPLLSRLVRWLSVRKIDKRVILKLDGDVFSNQERIGLHVFVQNESFVPVDGAEVKAKISRQDTVAAEIMLNGRGNGRYQGNLLPWGEGVYNIEISAALDDETLGNDSGSIRVEPFNIELLDVRLNDVLLKSVGEFSGGGYAAAMDADPLLNAIDLSSHDRIDSKRFELWGRGWLLALVIGLLAVEWFIRARLGML